MNGIDQEKIDFVKHLKTVKRGRISEYVNEFKGASYHEANVLGVVCDLALPCATQNELNDDEAKHWLEMGSRAYLRRQYAYNVSRREGRGKIIWPRKAANAGGVAVSGLEMSQNSERIKTMRDLAKC